MKLNLTADRWAAVTPDAFLTGSIAQARNVIEMATQDIAVLAVDRDRAERNRDMWKGKCERQADQLRALHEESAAMVRDRWEPTGDQILTVLREVLNRDFYKNLVCKRWKDGIDIDAPSYAAERLAGEFGALALAELNRRTSSVSSNPRNTQESDSEV